VYFKNDQLLTFKQDMWRRGVFKMKRMVQTTRGLFEVREEGREDGPVLLMLNGGHTNCDSPIPNLHLFVERGWRVLIPSRPGYGRTPSATGRSAEEAADSLVALLDACGVEKATVMGVSAAGRTTLRLAGQHPDRVDKVILQCALTRDEWYEPEQWKKYERVIRLMFNPYVEGFVWGMFRFYLRVHPGGALKSMMGQMTLLDPQEVLERLTAEQRKEVADFLRGNRSGSGFLNDITHTSGDLSRISAPTLIIQSKNDGSNPYEHALYACENIPNAELFTSEADSHLMWFGPHNAAIEGKIAEFIGRA
jgi:pimeloyl-ACP methyl ester carboxylesterase